MNCRVVVEAAVPVFDVETEDEAIRIAISKTGEMLNPDLNYVEINMGERTSPSGEELPPAFIAADEALVALELEMTVFNVEREEHASRIARKEIGQRLENIPLEVTEVEVLEEEEIEDETETETETEAEPESETEDEESESGGSDEADDAGNADEEDDEVLPEFEDLVE
ncbi:Uncharacterized protein, UPF0212 family [Halobiforma haloterrestris]|uniref:UPF0212 protein SAMN05444422_107245 n=1 Tax=Natronobacterium haloterrestre TaxID=148448 RepID=A0A1I1ITV9_NATHA|nr:DUF555 domain-containing protein [Halobiforma haloterrestris]SFC37163.1 Uncharacterized protein, UPF0212 family [Halobiforma haloterrestris]